MKKTEDNSDIGGAVGAAVWTKNNFPPRLEIIQGSSGVTQVPTDIASISEIIELFIGSDFQIMRRIIFCHNKNQDKFMSSP
jgi:hypothetical protein